MKKLVKSAIFGILIMCSGIVTAQEDQTTMANNVMPESLYTKYVINYDEGSSEYSITGCCADIWTISFKDYHESYKEITVKEFINSNMPDERYFPDEEVFPVTYVYGVWLGSPEEVEKYGAVEKKNTKRVVILNEWIYFLEKWKSKDDYIIVNLVRKGELKGMKGVKESFSAAKKNEGQLRKQELQDYLDAAFAKQTELLPAWKIKNKALIAEREANYMQVWADINNENDEYWNSEEGQARMARMRGEDASASKYTIQNNSGSKIHITTDMGTTSWLSAGASQTFFCETDMYYCNDDNSKGALIANGDNVCGQTINIE